MEIYNKTHNSEPGFALIMALIISSVVLSIGLSMLSITIKQVDLVATARESEIAFQAASLAMDCALMTRIRESTALATTSPTTNLNFDCGDINQPASHSTPGGADRHQYVADFDWNNSTGKDLKMVITMFVIGENASNRTYNKNDFSATCNPNIYCTYIFTEGYNRSQAEITAGASFSVQRELTAEF